MKDHPPKPPNDTAEDSARERVHKTHQELAREARALDAKIKERLLPPLDHLMYTILQGPEGKWRRLAFRVSHRNVGQARVTIELLGWADEPRPDKAVLAPATPADPDGTVTLDVHDGVIGGSTRFK